jgi:hypothetical protein
LIIGNKDKNKNRKFDKRSSKDSFDSLDKLINNYDLSQEFID